MTNYVCAELEPMQNGYIACKTWAVYDGATWVDKLAITPAQMGFIGGSIIGAFVLCMCFVMVAKAIRSL